MKKGSRILEAEGYFIQRRLTSVLTLKDPVILCVCRAAHSGGIPSCGWSLWLWW